jgi:hypothetical protein
MANLSIKTGVISRSMLVGNAAFVPPSYESIATATGTGSSGTITFSSIPQTYKSLQLRCLAFGSVLNQNTMLMRFNSDSGSNYARHIIYNNGTSVNVFASASTTFIGLGNYSRQLNSTNPTVAIVDIHDYASTSKNKTVRSIGGLDDNSSGELTLQSGVWVNTSAIDTISILTPGQNFTTNTVFSLYGVK